jgi:hypothetical protein
VAAIIGDCFRTYWDGRLHTLLAGDWTGGGVADLIAVQMRNTTTGGTQVHILPGEGAQPFSTFQMYQQPIGPPGARVGPTDSVNWAFVLANWNSDSVPDLWLIRKQGGPTTEVHILSGYSNFQTWLLHTGTSLPPTGSNHVFEAADRDGNQGADLFDIQMSQTATGKTEVHILNGSNLASSRLLDTWTPLGPTDSTNWAFPVADWSRDLIPDLIVLLRNGGTGSTEVHILGG